MAVTTSYSGSRRKNAHAAAFAAKQKRQKVIVGIGLFLLLLILAYEVPKTLKMMHGSSTPSASAPATPVTPVAGATGSATASTKSSSSSWHALRHATPHNPFASTVAGQSGTYGSVSVPSGLHDPFAGTVLGSSSTSPSTGASSTAATLPKTIVLGSPGAGRKAQTGWIVILASIPSAQGRSAANAFAKKAAGHDAGTVSILDSSKARPLRGGYWVVYTGPFPTLSAVTKDASHLHLVGYGTAYVRQLVVYRKS